MTERENKIKQQDIIDQLAVIREHGLQVETIETGGIKFSFANSREFLKIYRDIFEREEYFFQTNKRSPAIIDCGAHIGIATLYLKRLYPDARVICFEPNPRTFELLRLNIMQNGLSGVVFVNAALASENSQRPLNASCIEDSPWSWDDSCVQPKWNEPTSKTIPVRTVRLSSYLNQPIDLLKIDIEGMETEVLEEAQIKLQLVEECVIEFHGTNSNPTNTPERLLGILERGGFSIQIRQDRIPIDKDSILRTEPYWLLISARRKN